MHAYAYKHVVSVSFIFFPSSCFSAFVFELFSRMHVVCLFVFVLRSRECCSMHFPITYAAALYTVGLVSALSGNDSLREHMIVDAFSYIA